MLNSNLNLNMTTFFCIFSLIAPYSSGRVENFEGKGSEDEIHTCHIYFFQIYAIFMQNLGLKVSENHELYNFAYFCKVEAIMGIMFKFMRPLCS